MGRDAIILGAGAAVFAYGAFLMALLNFVIIAWVVFLLVKAVNRAQSAILKPAPEPEAPIHAAPVASPVSPSRRAPSLEKIRGRSADYAPAGRSKWLVPTLLVAVVVIAAVVYLLRR